VRVKTTRTASAVLLLVAGLLATGATSPGAVAAPAPTAPAATRAAAPALPDDVRLIDVKHSLLGTHRWYEQVVDGLPVRGAYYVVHDLGDDGVHVDDHRVDVPASAAAHAPTVSRTDLDSLASVPGRVQRRELVILPRTGRTAWLLHTSTGDEVVVDATSGEVLHVRSLLQHAEGTGKVFDPNPVTALNRQSLRDDNDRNSPAFKNAYRIVPLRHLNASGTLSGRWARITQAKGGLARSPQRSFRYQRADERFEQVQAYYGIDSIQSFLQELGFTDANAEAQKFQVNTTTDDNSFYDPTRDRIVFGTGGVDDAEDLEVVWHEYGHALQDAQVPGRGFGTTAQAGALGEGFGDYLAMAMSYRSDELSGRTPTTAYGCIADWDSVPYSRAPHCLRRTDTNLTMRDFKPRDIHGSGQIWSRALSDIHTAMLELGYTADGATVIIVQAQFAFKPGTTFRAAAKDTVEAAEWLVEDPEVTAAVRQAFVDRGILPG
jgi:Zn-dependent metalloprotease